MVDVADDRALSPAHNRNDLPADSREKLAAKLDTYLERQPVVPGR